MKKLTKLIACLFSFLLVAGTLSGQDIGVNSIISPVNGTALGTGITIPLQTTMKNFGSTTIPANTPFDFFVKAGNNNSIKFPIFLNQDLTSGSEVNLPGIVYTPAANTPSGPLEICYWVKLAGDADASNDTLCSTIHIYSTKRDVGVTSIITPDPNSTSLVPGDTTEFEFILKNFGDSGLVAGQIIRLAMLINNDTVKSIGKVIQLQSALAAGASAVVPITVVLPSLLPASVSVCFESRYIIDNVASNNKTCATYNTVMGIKDLSLLGSEVSAYPNPFSTITTIDYSLRGRSQVSLKVFNVTGQQVAVLVNAIQQPGRYNISFKRTGIPSGIYFYRLQVGDAVKTGKLVVE